MAKRHPHVMRAAVARRRANKLCATPPWVDLADLKAIHAACPPGHHTDHIHPLKGDLSCGLNVPWNLNYLPDRVNRTKGNKPIHPNLFDWWTPVEAQTSEPRGPRMWNPQWALTEDGEVCYLEPEELLYPE
jgi:hypothetical protein